MEPPIQDDEDNELFLIERFITDASFILLLTNNEKLQKNRYHYS